MDLKVYLQVIFINIIVGTTLATATFPPGFLWGTSTASYQVEGAWNESGRGETIWDAFAHKPGNIALNENGDVADDNYHLFREDIALMSKLGYKNYRFSIAWSRLFPTGRPPANPAGFQHYSDLIDELLENDIEPFVTLYHWDLPIALDGTWLKPSIIDDFTAYADAVFEAYGDRVKRWITFNEPWSFVQSGYGTGNNPPARCSDRTKCAEGDIAAHNVLLSHAAVVDIYRKKYQKEQNGIISITLNCDWAEPFSSSPDDIAAAQRRVLFQLGWFSDPVFKGDYPKEMRDLLGDRLPTFTAAQKALLNGSWDYFGLNHYTAGYAKHNPVQDSAKGWHGDQKVTMVQERNGEPIGLQGESTWLYVVPWGIRKVLNWVTDRYDNPPLYITENGVDVPNESNIPLPDVLYDQFRIHFYSQYLSNVAKAIDDGVDVRGYFAWSFLDNFEWGDGYTKRFGLIYVDYANGLQRYSKASAYWYSKFIQENSH